MIKVFPEIKLRGLVPNYYIHVSLSNSYIPRDGLPIRLLKIGRPILGIYLNRSQIHECGNWETEHYNSVLEITRLRSFISDNTEIGTRHLYGILIGPSFSVSRPALSCTVLSPCYSTALVYILSWLEAQQALSESAFNPKFENFLSANYALMKSPGCTKDGTSNLVISLTYGNWIQSFKIRSIQLSWVKKHIRQVLRDQIVPKKKLWLLSYLFCLNITV
jgi:hypothetical protein